MKKVILAFLFFQIIVSADAQKIPEYIINPKITVKDPGAIILKELVLVNAGNVVLAEDDYQTPKRNVTIEPFFIQEKEVTNLWYKRFMQDLAKTNPAEALKMMPDTASWENDYKYSYNEPMKIFYFSHPAYQNYPVVGIRYDQAVEFAKWANEKLKGYLKRNPNSKLNISEIRLPTADEWQYAAMGGLERSCFGYEPSQESFGMCGVFTLFDAKANKFRANYKPDDGNFLMDGAFHTAPVASYMPNAYHLYDMIGNVSEWVESNPNEKMKSVKGGSWADDYKKQYINRLLQINGDSAHCTIGFRLAASTKKEL